MDRGSNPPRAPMKRRPSDMVTADLDVRTTTNALNVPPRSTVPSRSHSNSSVSSSIRDRTIGGSSSSLHRGASTSNIHNNVVHPPPATLTRTGSASSQYNQGSTSSSFSFPPPPPPTMEVTTTQTLSITSLSTTSASATRSHRSGGTNTSNSSSSSVRSPRGIERLLQALYRKVHGSPSFTLQRRIEREIRQEGSTSSSSSFYGSSTILQKIQQKMHLYGISQTTIDQLQESYARFIKLPNYDKKGETLELLFQLMDISGNPGRSQSSDRGPAPMEVEGDGTTHQSLCEPKATELDALEDSFKFAVGIAGNPSRSLSASRNSTLKRESVVSISQPSITSGLQHSFDVPEEVLLRDVIFALQAIDSRYLYFDKAVDRFQIIRSVGISSPMRELIHRLCELGWFYRKITEYLNHYRQDLSFGVVGHSFCHVINLELGDYFRLLATLSAHIDADVESKKSQTSNGELTLRQLAIWVTDPLERMRIMARLIDAVDGFRGGALASVIHGHILHGDPAIRSFVQHVMKAVAAPIFRMIRTWVFEGELDDTNNEFFIVADPKVTTDLLWGHKYHLNHSMLPSFISLELAKKVLVIGKSINFIRKCCGHNEWIMNTNHSTVLNIHSTIEFEENGITFTQLTTLETMITQVSSTTNEYLIHTLMDKYLLLDHCRALRKFMLLGQGDFIQYLMDLLRPELSKRASNVHSHTLRNVLETALNASNAKYESADILARLDVELLRGSPTDSGWDIFTLHYKVPSPVNTVIHETAMLEYQQIFHFLWRLKRVEHSLSTLWTENMHLDHMIHKCYPEIRCVIHKCQCIGSEMIQFTTTLLNYIMFEVLETSWHQLVKDLKAARDLNELITGHEDYIASIKLKGFMTEESKELLKELKVIFDTVLMFCRLQAELYTKAMKEVDKSNTRRKMTEKRSLHGTWGLSDKNELMGTSGHATFGSTSPIYMEMDAIGKQFTSQVITLLKMLGERRPSGTESLSLLVTRFDFNEYYQNILHPREHLEEL